MKWIFKLTILLLVAVVALGAYSFVLPATSIVEQTVVLQAPPERIFTYINNPTQWEAWSVWSRQHDPNIVHMYGGPLAGSGARHTWISDKSGNGQRMFTESVEPLRIAYEQSASGETFATSGVIMLEKVPEGTRIVWQQITTFNDTMLDRYKAAWHTYKSEKELQQGLAGLEALLQQKQVKKVSRGKV